jgi:hypothetical protein
MARKELCAQQRMVLAATDAARWRVRSGESTAAISDAAKVRRCHISDDVRAAIATRTPEDHHNLPPLVMNLRMRHMRAIVRSVKLCIEQRKEDMNVINDIGELTASPTKAQLLQAIMSMSAYRHRLAIASGMRGHLPRALLDCAYARVIEIQRSMILPLHDTMERHGELESAQADLNATREVALALEPHQPARDCAPMLGRTDRRSTLSCQ